MKTKQLNNNQSIPVIGFGTYSLQAEEAERAVEHALNIGYTHLDTAEGYKNEENLGKVLANYNRDDLFITSKVVPSNLNYENVLRACERSLEKLGISHLDLYLIHWPNPAISLRETLQAMEKLVTDGKVKSVGVSNFSLNQLKFALKLSRVPITVNQIEFHPFWPQKKLLDFCHENEVAVTAAAPLGRTEFLEKDIFKQLAKKYNRTPAQIILRWEREKGVIPLPRSTSKKHIEENLAILDWKLEKEDIELIDNINERYKAYSYSIDHEIYGVSS